MDSNIESIAKLIDYMEDHLTEPLNLEILAEESGYSKYHLHRMFTGVVGMPVHSYLQRRRLTEAARMLIFTDMPILDIALQAGYGTQQSFSKAFKEQFRHSPKAFRNKESFYPLQLKYKVDGQRQLRGDRIMDFKIVQAEEILLVGYKASTVKGFSVIPKCWAQMERRKNHIPNRVDRDTLVALDDYTCDFAEGNQPAFDYYAAAEVSSLEDVPPGMATRRLPPGKYVVFSYKGTPQDSMQPVVEYIYREWFPQSTARLNEQAMYDFSKLGEVLDSEGRGDVEFWVPIL